MVERERKRIFDEQINFKIDEKTKHNSTVIIVVIIVALVDVVRVRTSNGTHTHYTGCMRVIRSNAMHDLNGTRRISK